MWSLLLKNWKPILAAAVVVGGVLWLRSVWMESGEERGRAAVQALWDAEKAEAAEALREEEKRREEKRKKDEEAAKEVQRELEERVAESDARSADLARRLREWQARSCRGSAMPAAPGAAAGTGGAAGVPQDEGAAGTAVDLALENHLAACGRDAERLAGWQDWWGRVTASP